VETVTFKIMWSIDIGDLVCKYEANKNCREPFQI